MLLLLLLILFKEGKEMPVLNEIFKDILVSYV